jgi:negative modulator of initiation of replication
MHSIDIDDQVFTELSNRATGFHVTPNDVLRRLLELEAASSLPSALRLEPNSNGAAEPTTLAEFLRSARFRTNHQAVDKFLAVLGWLNRVHPEQFAKAAEAFRRGSRRYFAKSEGDILQSGEGVTAKPIPQSDFWALTTLDNKSKRIVLEDMLRGLGYSKADINLVLAELPDSGIRRTSARSRILASL